MEPFEYKGNFWFPDIPDETFPGIVSFEPKTGVALEIIGQDITVKLPGWVEQSDANLSRVIEIVLGFTDKGVALTLYRCLSFGFTWSTGYGASRFKVTALLLGCHFNSKEEILLDKLRVRFEHLDIWFGASGFNNPQYHKNANDNTIGVTINYFAPETVSAKLDDFSLHIIPLWDAEIGLSETTIKQSTVIEIVSNKSVPLEAFTRPVELFRHFLNLGLNVPIQLKSTIGHTNNGHVRIGTVEKQIRTFEIYSRDIGVLVEKVIPKQYEVLFYYNDIANHLIPTLEKWFQKADLLEPIIDLYFSRYYLQSTYVRSEFLTLAQVIEAFHRRVYGGQFMAAADYRPVQDELKKTMRTVLNGQNLNAEFRRRIESSIEYSYEFSLRNRLKLLLNDILNVYKPIVDNFVEDTDGFVHKVVTLRNDLIHIDNEGNGVRYSNSQIVELVEKLQLILQLCFCLELGFPVETVQKIAARNVRFHRRRKK
jgi:hypothetical protein